MLATNVHTLAASRNGIDATRITMLACKVSVMGKGDSKRRGVNSCQRFTSLARPISWSSGGSLKGASRLEMG
jgi:hypothetical protein